MGLEIEEEIKRKPVDLNLAAARAAKSPQTGFIHLCYQSNDTRHDTIPMLENFCYALALLRSRLVDNILEAKLLIEKLLKFEVNGNFPIYLHEYPQCKKRSHGIDLIPVFHWILQDFHQVLGQELELQLKESIERLTSYGMKTHSEKPLSFFSLFKLQSDLIDFQIPRSSEEWGELLIGYQLAESQGVDRSDFLKKALQKWNEELCTPICMQHQAGFEPQPTLFDLFMGHYFKKYSKRALIPQRIHLLGALVHPFAAILESISKPASWLNFPFTLYWGCQEMLHSLSLDLKKSESLQLTEDRVLFTLPIQAPSEGEEAIESSFYLNLHSDHTVLINSEKATTFQLEDTIEIFSKDRKITLKFELIEGEGRFFGHLLRSNRPHQTKATLFETFDWQIAVRTIARSEHCVVRWVILKNF